MKAKKLKIRVSKEIGSVSGLLMMPKKAKSILVLSHGAGAGMTHHFMEDLSQKLAERNMATLRFNFPYMENKKGAPDRPPKAHATIRAAIEKALKLNDKITLLAGGKSFGGRMTSQLAAEGGIPEVQGIIYFGFPLHAPGKDSIDRAAHLKDVKIKQLFLQGTRDKLANLDMMRAVCKKLRYAKLKIIDGGDHSFKMLKRSGRTDEDALNDLANHTVAFAEILT